VRVDQIWRKRVIRETIVYITLFDTVFKYTHKVYIIMFRECNYNCKFRRALVLYMHIREIADFIELVIFPSILWNQQRQVH
jgi:hypothetical protein